MNLVDIVLYIILPTFMTIYFLIKKRYRYFKDRGIPYVEPKFPLGNMRGIGTRSHMVNILRDVYEEVKGKDVIAGFYSMIQPVYLIMDLELAKHVMIKDFNSFVNRGMFHNEEDEPLTGHLANVEDEKWRFLRNKLSPVFTSGKMKAMFNTISDKGRNLVAAIERASNAGKSVDTRDQASRFTIDIISSVAFGLDANTLNGDHPELPNFGKQVFGAEGINPFQFFFMTTYPKLSKRLKLRQFGRELSDFFIGIIGENVKYREKANDNRPDFLNMLIQLKNKGSVDGDQSNETKKLTLNEIMAQAFVFYFGGSETSSTTMTFALMELARNKDIQEKLREEIAEKTRDDDGKITYDNLNEMTYLNQVVNETLRMYAVGFANMRIANEDYQIPNSKHIIPKGSQVWIPVIGFHFDEYYWKNPTIFDPTRFTQEEIANRPANVFTPFGEGPRNCIGMRFGLMNVKYGVAEIVKNFKLTIDPSVKYPVKMNPKSPLLEPDQTILIKFEKI